MSKVIRLSDKNYERLDALRLRMGSHPVWTFDKVVGIVLASHDQVSAEEG